MRSDCGVGVVGCWGCCVGGCWDCVVCKHTQVLSASPYGVYGVVCKLVDDPPRKPFVDFMPGGEVVYEMYHIADLKDWEGYKNVGEIEQGIGEDGSFTSYRLQLRLVCEDPLTLLELSALEGFKGLQKPVLIDIALHYGWQVRRLRGMLVDDLVRLLIGNACPDLPADLIEEIVAARNNRKFAPGDMIARVIDDDAMKVLKEALPEDEHQQVSDDIKKHEAVKETEQKARRIIRRPRAPSPSSSVAAAPAAPSSPLAVPSPPEAAPVIAPLPPAAAPVAALALRAIENRRYDASEARMFCPVAKGCTISIHTDHAWSVKYARVTPGYKSHTCTWNDKVTFLQALCKCLEWAWDRHVEAGCSPCPFDLHEHLEGVDFEP